MNVLVLYSDDNGVPKQHILQNAPEDFSLADGFDLSALPDCNADGAVFFVLLDDMERPTVLDAASGEELGATFGLI